MSALSSALLVQSLASVCPSRGLAQRLEGRFEPLLKSAGAYHSPQLYSMFSVSLFVYPAAGEMLSLLVPMPQALMLLGSLCLLQLCPVVYPLSLSYSRQRHVNVELPFFLLFLSVLSRDSSPTLDEGLRRVADLGDSVLPAFKVESGIVERDLAYSQAAPAEVLEQSLHGHPSKDFRQFVQAFMTTITTGKSVAEFVDEESSRQVDYMEARWRGFAESVGSLAEASLMILALFPVGLEMVTAAIPGLGADQLILFLLGLMALFTVVLVFVVDAVQPVDYNSRIAALPLCTSVLAWAVSTLLFYNGLITIEDSILVPLLVSAAGAALTRKAYSVLRKGEEEVSLLLHVLSEEAKAGVSLPGALTMASSSSVKFASIGPALATFQQSIMLGASPDEAQSRVSHPSWLVRLSFGMLSTAFATGVGYEKLERLSSFFRRISDARKNASRSLVPFFLVGVIVPGISIAATSFLSTFGQSGGIPFLPTFAGVSKTYVLISISAVSVMTGILLSKFYTQTARHAVAVPILMASTLVSLLVFGSP